MIYFLPGCGSVMFISSGLPGLLLSINSVSKTKSLIISFSFHRPFWVCRKPELGPLRLLSG